MSYAGGCHCGNLRVRFRPARTLDELDLRACQCSFCRRHGARTVSDAEGSLELTVLRSQDLTRLRFATRTADFLICRTCGVYVAAVLVGSDPRAALNVNALDAPDPREARPVRYDGESAAERRERRRVRWTPLRETTVARDVRDPGPRGARAEATYTGSCLCGSIRYEISGELGDFGYCHCTSCRKASGSAHSANSPVDRSDFRLLGGASTLREYESSPGKIRAFCEGCGSPILAYLESSPEVIRIRLGTLDTPFAKRPKAHTFVGDKASWEPIEGELRQFSEWAARSLLHQRGSRQGGA